MWYFFIRGNEDIWLVNQAKTIEEGVIGIN